VVSIASLTFVGYVVALLVQKKKKGVVPRIFKFMICIFSQIVISVCLSRAVLCNSRPVEGLSVEIMARGGHCQIFPMKFDRL